MKYFYPFVLINGFLAISFEILALRLMAPFFGSGTIQTSFIIGTVLLFYSLGNFYSHRQKNCLDLLRRNIFIAIIFHGLILTHPTLNLLSIWMNHLGLNFYLQLSLVNLVSIAPLAFLYGQNLPSLIDLDPFKKSNLILGYGTIGSFLGSVLTAILLVFILPASWMVILNTALCFFLGLWLFKKNIFLATFIPLLASLYLNLVYVKKPNEWETGVSTYSMDVKEGFKGLKIDNEKYSSFLINDSISSPYNEFVHEQLLNSKNPKDVLILGAGGMTLSRRNKHHNYRYVDIDPKMKEIISKGFNKVPHGEFIFSDARAFLIRDTRSYDVIMQDTFSRFEVPRHLMTREHFQLVKDHLRPNGYFVFNVSHQGTIFENKKNLRLHKTIQIVFPHCFHLPINGKKLYEDTGFQQTLILCQKSTQDRTIKPLTDDDY